LHNLQSARGGDGEAISQLDEVQELRINRDDNLFTFDAF
jgi:hypothetical protein